MRMKGSTLSALEEEAAKYRAAPRRLAEEMVEEALKMRRHPGIIFFEHAGGRRDAALAARPRLSVWMIVEVVRGSTSLAAAAKYLSLDLPAIERALTYYKEHPDEIDEQIAANDAEMQRIMRLYPSTADLARAAAPRSSRPASRASRHSRGRSRSASGRRAR